MNRTRILFFTIILISLIIVGLATLFSDRSTNTPANEAPANSGFTDPTSVPLDSVLVTIASSSTKQNWMEEVATTFNAEGQTTSGGSTIIVEVQPVLSGGSMNSILDGGLTPVVWSPGSNSWVRQMNETWQQRNNKDISSSDCDDSIYTPLGFAMWRPMAETLGWPDKPIGWQTIVDLANDPDGWASLGRPEWGKFRFGHAHPQYSNAGLLTMTSFVYGITGKTDALSANEVYADEVQDALTTMAQNTSKYGRITTDLLNLMALEGPSYLHAVATFESDTIRFNQERADELQFPLAFVFPSEGTFWGSHPYCILDNTDWVTEEQAEAAGIFQKYMLAEEQQTLAIQSLLRPLDSSIELQAPLDLENGTDPSTNPNSIPSLADPEASVGASIIDLFLLTKRKATILLVLDTSGSMEGDKIRSATQSTAEFLTRLDANDEVGVVTFADEVMMLSEPSLVSNVAESLGDRVLSLVADGSTSLYQAVCSSVEQLLQMQEEDLAAGESRLYGLTLLSDGEDTVGTVTENQMFATCLPQSAEADGIKIFPIAFGADADINVLQRIARVSGGKMFPADPETIDRVYVSISAEQ
ncbi:MAG: extracellular solute-binding protein [Chloroflexota bacterium]